MDPQAMLSSVSTNPLFALAIVSNEPEPAKAAKRKMSDVEMSLSVHVPSTVSMHVHPSENVDQTVESFRQNFNLQLTTGERHQVSNKSKDHPSGYLTQFENLYGVKSVRVDPVQRVLVKCCPFSQTTLLTNLYAGD